MSELVKYEYRQEEIEVMNEQKNKQWSLLLFRKYENIYYEDIETAKFKFGRTQEEVLENKGEFLSKSLISIIKTKNLQDVVMETGFVISFTTTNPRNDNFILLDKLLSSPPTFRKYGYSLYIQEQEYYPLRFVDLGKVDDYKPMPNKIWIRLRPLTINEISWGIENNIFEGLNNNEFKGEQWCLNEFGFDIQKAKKKKEPQVDFEADLPLPGPSEFNYEFLN